MRHTPSGALMTHSVLNILFVLADIFYEIGVRDQIEMKSKRPRFRVHFGIVDRAFHLQVARVDALESFGHAHFFGVWQAQAIEP